MTAEAFPTTPKITRITPRKQTRSSRLMTENRGRKKHSEQEDDDDANAGWKLVLYFAPVLFLFSWIVQGVLDARKRKAASLQFEPNALPSIGSVNGEEQCKPYGTSPVLDKLAAALSITGEPQQKAAGEKPTRWLSGVG